MKHILKCSNCKTYTLKETCPKCKARTESTRPLKFSPDDKFGKYRREERKQILKKKGLF